MPADPHQHVIEAVFLHGFIDAADWERGLGELARMTDEQIDAAAAEAFAARVKEQQR